MALDDAETIRRFILQIKGEPEYSNLATSTIVSSPPSTLHEQPANQQKPASENMDGKHIDQHNKSEGAKTPPHALVAGHGNRHLTSPETHPKPSPSVSGLKAPYNTPKTAASSPRLAAMNTHNEDVAEAFSAYVNTVDSHPLSESIWAPGSARYQPPTLTGARPTRFLTPVKAVDPNPAINETFDRMSFRAADPEHKISENLIGEHFTRALFSEAPPSFVNKFSVLTNKISEGNVEDADEAKLKKTSDEDFKPPTGPVQKAQRVQVKANGVGKKDSSNIAHTDGTGKENEAPPAPKAYVPPHLRAKQVSSQQLVNAETIPSCSEVSVPIVTSKVADPGSGNRAATDGIETKATTGSAGTKPLTAPISASEDLEHKAVFSSWPKQEERSRPAAKVRTVIIKALPRDSTASFVASLVYGGPIEEIHIRSSAAGDLSATVRFLDSGDCTKFYEETSNGIVYKKDSKDWELVLFLELSKDVDVVGGLLQGWIASGVTRCVRAVGVEAEWGLEGLLRIAERKNRKVEKIVDGQNAGGARSVVFRFCNVEDAVQFKAALSRDEEWEHCNIHYAADPCAMASGVHLES